MPILIKRNEEGNCIEFRGSSNPVYFNACLEGEVDENNSDLVNIVNLIKTDGSTSKEYEFFNLPYSEFLSESGQPFNSAEEVANYVTEKGNVSQVNLKTFLESSNTYDVTPEDNRVTVVMQKDSDWVVTLPNINTVPENFAVSITHRISTTNSGEIVPFSSDLIDGNSNKSVFGKTKIDLIKKDGQWEIINQISFFDEKEFGKTKRHEFTQESTVTVNHNLGNIPIVQVWTTDENGNISDSNVEVVHDWTLMNSFSVLFNSPQDGYIVYI